MAVGTTPPPDFSLEDSLPPTLDSQAGSGDSSGLPPSMQFDPQEYAAAGPGAAAGNPNGAHAVLSDQGVSGNVNVPGETIAEAGAASGAMANGAPTDTEYPSTGVDTLDLNALAAELEDDPAAVSSQFSVPGVTSNDAGTSNPPKSNPLAGESIQRQAAQTALANAIATADRQREEDRLREALATLSLFYNSPNLNDTDRQALLGRLDWLAGEVIYSKRHLVEQPYRVSQGETLEDVAAKLEVPVQLLATINDVKNPASIVPGQELKVVRGPFRAEVSIGRSELTLFAGELYAGRFPFTAGNDPAPRPGSYAVMAKQTDRTFYSLGGGNIPAGDPRNPYGTVWIDLGNQMSIHGSASQPSEETSGCIQLRQADAEDVFGILSNGSTVTIIR